MDWAGAGPGEKTFDAALLMGGEDWKERLGIFAAELTASAVIHRGPWAQGSPEDARKAAYQKVLGTEKYDLTGSWFFGAGKQSSDSLNQDIAAWSNYCKDKPDNVELVRQEADKIDVAGNPNINHQAEAKAHILQYEFVTKDNEHTTELDRVGLERHTAAAELTLATGTSFAVKVNDPDGSGTQVPLENNGVPENR
jgi:hypothetical protein